MYVRRQEKATGFRAGCRLAPALDEDRHAGFVRTRGADRDVRDAAKAGGARYLRRYGYRHAAHGERLREHNDQGLGAADSLASMLRAGESGREIADEDHR